MDVRSLARVRHWPDGAEGVAAVRPRCDPPTPLETRVAPLRPVTRVAVVAEGVALSKFDYCASSRSLIPVDSVDSMMNCASAGTR